MFFLKWIKKVIINVLIMAYVVVGFLFIIDYLSGSDLGKFYKVLILVIGSILMILPLIIFDFLFIKKDMGIEENKLIELDEKKEYLERLLEKERKIGELEAKVQAQKDVQVMNKRIQNAINHVKRR